VVHITKIKVRFFTSLSALVGKDEIELEISDPYTIEDLLKEMEMLYGLWFRKVMERDNFEGYVPGDASKPAVLVNRCSISLQKDLRKRLNDGDEVVFLPAMGGG
jgi:MoaD family protein